jgi:hypothetical protein
MAKKTSPVEIPASVRPVLQAAAKNLLHHLYGPAGPPWGTSFAQLEDLVALLSDTLSSELLQQALQRQAQQPLPASLQQCPSCGRPTESAAPEPRVVHARRGSADWQEPAYQCRHCRKAFFPSVG